MEFAPRKKLFFRLPTWPGAHIRGADDALCMAKTLVGIDRSLGRIPGRAVTFTDIPLVSEG